MHEAPEPGVQFSLRDAESVHQKTLLRIRGKDEAWKTGELFDSLQRLIMPEVVKKRIRVDKDFLTSIRLILAKLQNPATTW